MRRIVRHTGNSALLTECNEGLKHALSIFRVRSIPTNYIRYISHQYVDSISSHNLQNFGEDSTGCCSEAQTINGNVNVRKQ